MPTGEELPNCVFPGPGPDCDPFLTSCPLGFYTGFCKCSVCICQSGRAQALAMLTLLPGVKEGPCGIDERPCAQRHAGLLRVRNGGADILAGMIPVFTDWESLAFLGLSS